MTTAAVNARCMNPACLWVGRSRPARLDLIGLGQGLFAMMRLVCECGSEPDTEVASVAAPAMIRRDSLTQP